MRSLLAVLLVMAAVERATARPTASELVRNPAWARDRVLVARHGAAGWSRDAMAADTTDDAGGTSYPVVQETADAVRILVDGDEARVLVWIARTDLAWTVARSTRILGTGDVGVWARPGQPLAITGDGRRVAVHVVDPLLTVDGTIDRRTLAHRHRPPSPPPLATLTARGPLAHHPDGPVLVTPTDGLGVTVVDRGPGDWVLVEHTSARLRVRGWTRHRDLSEGELSLGTVGASGYGMSHTARVWIDAGACMFDERGVVIGVQTTRSERYADDLGGGRWSVYVGTPWGLRTVVVVDRKRGQGDPAWQRCP